MFARNCNIKKNRILNKGEGGNKRGNKHVTNDFGDCYIAWTALTVTKPGRVLQNAILSLIQHNNLNINH